MFLSNSLFCCIADITVKLVVLPVGRHQRTSKQFLDNYQKSSFFKSPPRLFAVCSFSSTCKCMIEK